MEVSVILLHIEISVRSRKSLLGGCFPNVSDDKMKGLSHYGSPDSAANITSHLAQVPKIPSKLVVMTKKKVTTSNKPQIWPKFHKFRPNSV